MFAAWNELYKNQNGTNPLLVEQGMVINMLGDIKFPVSKTDGSECHSYGRT